MENQIMIDAAFEETTGRRTGGAIRRLAALCLLVCASLATLPAAAEALLWRIEAGDTAPSYLFGTIHSDDPRVATLPEPVAQTLAQSRVLYLEIDFAAPEIALVPFSQVLPPGQSLQDLLSEDVYRRVLTAMAARGYTATTVDRLRPWAVVLELAMPPMESGNVLDLVLLEYAMNRGIETRGLETIGEQLGLFANMPMDDQRALLVLTLEEYAESPRAFEEMILAYAAGDLAELERQSEEAFTKLAPDFAARFEAAIVTRRNHRMAERAAPAIAQGGAFIAVGALHLPGEDGLITLLRNRGYRLTPVY